MIHSSPIAAHRIVCRRNAKSHAAEANDAVLHVRRVEAAVASAAGRARIRHPENQHNRWRRVQSTVGTKCHARRQFGPRTLARAQLRQNYTEGGGRGRLAGARCRGRSPLRPVMARTTIIIPIEDDELEPSGRVVARIHTGNVPRGDAVSPRRRSPIWRSSPSCPPALPGAPFFVSRMRTIYISASAGSESWEAAIPSL
jgi:hypothetical protein